MVEGCGKSGQPVQLRHFTKNVFFYKLTDYNFIVSGLSG